MGECRCSQHVRGIRADSAQGVAPGQPLIGAVTFSDAADTFRGSAEIYGLLNETQSMVEDFVAGLAEPEEDAATVVELVKRGDSWHISIRAGVMYHETAEGSWGAAMAAVTRVLGESPFLDSYAEVQTHCRENEALPSAAVRAERFSAGYDAGLYDGRRSVLSCVSKSAAYLAGREAARAELLTALPPCQITDSEALAKLTPSRVRAYLKGKGWEDGSVDGFLEEWGWAYKRADLLHELSKRASRSAAAVYLDILAAEPGEGQP